MALLIRGITTPVRCERPQSGDMIHPKPGQTYGSHLKSCSSRPSRMRYWIRKPWHRGIFPEQRSGLGTQPGSTKQTLPDRYVVYQDPFSVPYPARHQSALHANRNSPALMNGAACCV